MPKAKTAKKSRKQRLAETAPSTGLPRDTGPAERWQHGDEAIDELSDTPGVTRRRVTTQTPLDRYLARGQITQEQWEAGDWLRRRFEAARLVPGAAALDPAKIRVDCGARLMETTAAQSEAHRDVLDALRAVGPELAPVLVSVCCMGEAASSWAKADGYDGTRAKIAGVITLQHALNTLARLRG